MGDTAVKRGSKMGRSGLKGSRFISKLKIKKFKRKAKTADNLDDGEDALNILPVEMWTIILNKVEDFDDRWSCYNTCQALRSIIGPSSLYTEGFEKILPGVIKHFDLPTLLVCRQVCKNWCESIDTLVANSSKLRPYDFNREKPRTTSDFYIAPSWELTSIRKVRTLILGVKNHPRDKCPIVGRYLQMHHLSNGDHVIPEQDIQQHHDLSCALLSIMGQHVYYFSLMFNPSQLTPLNLCQLLRRQLRHLTNLRMLVIDHNFGIRLPWTSGDYQALVPYLRENPLPHSQTLESLVFQADNIPMLVQHQLVWIHGAQLKYLKMSLDRLTPTLLQRLASLTELSTFVESNIDIRALLRCNAPLQKLRLVLGIGTRLFARNLLQIISHFPQLRELELKLTFNCQLRDDGCTLGSQWNCYSVKNIYIDFDADKYDWNLIQPRLSFNFLKCLPSLERIRIVHHVLCPVVSTIAEVIDRVADGGERGNWYFMDLVQLGGYMREGLMHKSNVWKLLPKLESFHYQWFDRHHDKYGEHYHSRFLYEMEKRRRDKLVRRVGRALGSLCMHTAAFCFM